MFREKLLISWLLVKSNWLPAVLAGIGILLILIGLLLAVLQKNEENSITFESSNEASPSSKIFVDVSGAVIKPGVYELSSTSRLQEALILAGGLSDSADRDWVARNLNLAIKLKDGTKIYIPRMGESVSQKTQGISGSVNQIIGASEGLINVNTASLSELDKLPGIGPVTAQKIIDSRPYGDVDELLSKKIVGTKVFEQIKDKIAIY